MNPFIANISSARRLSKLGDLVDVETGFQFRKGIEFDPKGEAFALQLKDVAEDGSISWKTLERVNGDSVNKKYFIRKHDVLIAARGTRNQTFAITDDVSNVIAPSHFFILRPKGQNLLAEYLAWFLQLPSTRSLLEKERMGTFVKMLPRIALGEISVSLPTIEIQKKIIAITKLMTREATLVSELQSKREFVLQNLLINRIQDFSTKGE